MEDWLATALDEVCKPKRTKDGRKRYRLGDWDLTLPGGNFTDVWECYQWLASVTGRNDQTRLTKLESEHDELVRALILTPTEGMRDKIAGEARRLESEISKLKSTRGGLAGAVKELLVDLTETAKRLTKAKRSLASEDLRKQAKAYHDLLERITVVHGPVGTRSGKPLNRLLEVRITPKAACNERSLRGSVSC